MDYDHPQYIGQYSVTHLAAAGLPTAAREPAS